ncbi:MAG: immunoglobulin domain-containing protein [Phycisphaerales bacterium]|nr:immunoglobulin domain-containing protein [Phycisphaerales bacterium]
MPLNDTWLLHHATVTADPEDLVLDRGGHAEFTVEVLASGSPAFHWRRDGVALVDDDRHQGARSPTLVIDPLEVGDAGLYDCVIDNRCGSTASAAAQLTVLDPPECPDILFLRAECRDHVLKVKVKLATDAHDGLFLTVDINNVERPRLAIRGHVAKRRFRDRVNRQVVALVDPPDCGLVQDADCGP